MTLRFPRFLALLSLLSINALGAVPIVIAPPPAEAKPFTDTTLGPVGPQRTPDVASDGQRWLAVWADARHGNLDVYGTILSETGEPLHPAGIPLGATYGSDSNPQVAWTGEHYLVVWVSELGIFNARVDREGRVLGSDLTLGSPHSAIADGSWMAWNGESALIVWSWRRSGTADEFLIALLDEEGRMKGSTALVTNRVPASGISVAVDGSGFLLAWEGQTEAGIALMTVAISDVGVVGPVHQIALLPARKIRSFPALAVSGSSRLLLWSDVSLRGVTLGRGGEPLTESFTILEGSAPDGVWASSDLIPTEEGWIASISGGRLDERSSWYTAAIFDSYLLRLGADGRALATVRLGGTPALRTDPTIAANSADRVFTAWEADGRIAGAVHASPGLQAVSPERLIALGVTQQANPSIVTHGEGRYLAAWEENGWNVAVLDADGRIVHPPIRLWGKPLLASTGELALAIWTELDPVTLKPARIVGIRLGPYQLLDPYGFVIAEGYAATSLATDGTNFVVVMREELAHPSGYGAGYRLRSAVVRADGSVGISVPVAPAVYQWQADSALAWTGEHYLAVWNERNLCIAGHCTSDLRAIRIDRNGFPTTAEARFVTQTLSRENEIPRSLACNGTECAITWSVGFGDRVSRLSETGERLDRAVTEPGIALPQFLTGASSVIWDGERWVVGIGAMAPLPSGELLRISERVSIPLPHAHQGTLTRLQVDRVAPGRKRALSSSRD